MGIWRGGTRPCLAPSFPEEGVVFSGGCQRLGMGMTRGDLSLSQALLSAMGSVQDSSFALRW